MSIKPAKQVEEFKAKCKKEAEKVVKEVFPQKVIELNKLLESEDMQMIRISKIETDVNIPEPPPGADLGPPAEPSSKKRKLDGLVKDVDMEKEVNGTKVYALPLGTVPCNKHLKALIAVIKPHILQLIDSCNQVKMWIAYSIPRIEDGNNFGVSVQEDSMSEARQCESEAATYLDQISRYYTTRAKIVSKVAKYPHIADYREAVKELDEKQFLSMRLIVTELRNQYASLHDMILKNFDKIIKPRSSNSDNLY